MVFCVCKSRTTHSLEVLGTVPGCFKQNGFKGNRMRQPWLVGRYGQLPTEVQW